MYKMISIFGFMITTIMLFVSSVVSQPRISFTKILLPPNTTSPESVAVDRRGNGPYVTLADGRVLKWLGPDFGFMDFATTSPDRTKDVCDGTLNPDLIFQCGRPLGFSFDTQTDNLYIVDGVLGLYVVGPNGGQATRLASSAEGITFRFLNGVDVDTFTGIVYFTSSSTTYDIRNITQPGFQPDKSGRLLKYDPSTKQVTVLLRQLYVPIGPAVSLDGSFLVFSEYGNKRILRYWLKGLRANTVEVLFTVPGYPSKIKRTSIGDFWVPVNIINPATFIATPMGFRFNSFGTVVQKVDFSSQYANQNITVLNEQNGVLRVGCRTVNFIGIYSP
ncbi:hypothetical protein DCAR_0209311 [Daucus carota subsp. sativus]|uniref:Strictosidine synthase conserved region domain-containing protein n=2 Tax=Daucus carota subsp. sativus TaxID=79200 RepID=A0AAF0WL04_DAUCS|nr:PREDICTED: protein STRICTOSIDINE SYNTHASE-LIKE 11-like [Daucus carota subsp. sativus]XP_017234484.1 PREDICTED: protein STRICTOSIDINE SYNTHASE-LIKE 11-like [Daucus carota subsp. sativus]WOG90070.1 hypothetical protein DCAR_0209311 [Daucus carota subsp. sativus]